MKLKKKWTLCLIHHTHTDIGYTDRQEKIERYHDQYINQVVRLQREKTGFKWVCETFWAVEQYLGRAGKEQIEAFEAAVRAGSIEVTGNYLNLTELVDDRMVGEAVKRAAAYGHKLGVPVRSAMTADVNGYSRDYARALVEHGVGQLFACVHTHHGMYPARRKQHPFWWEVGAGERLLVWNGEHYMIGNDLGLVPGGLQSYLIKDEFGPPWSLVDEEQLRLRRISRYLNQLEEERYPFDFVPVTLAGRATDNAPPNGAIADMAADWNALYGNQVQLEMMTLSSFFDRVRGAKEDLPVYEGEWPDWWSDGYVSTPEATRLFRQGQRNLWLAELLRPDRPANGVYDGLYRSAAYPLMMYAEHTWGHMASVSEPFSQLATSMLARKEAYAAEGLRHSFILLDRVLEDKGEAELYPGRPYRFKVVNPHAEAVSDWVRLVLDNWEGELLDGPIRLADAATGEIVKHQQSVWNRNRTLVVPLQLSAKEERVLEIRPLPIEEECAMEAGPVEPPSVWACVELGGCDGVMDIKAFPGELWSHVPKIRISESSLETDFVRIRWRPDRGITSWLDKATGQEWLQQDAEYSIFAPVYELTAAPNDESQGEIRRAMGRNRKGMHVRREAGRLVQAKPLQQGDVLGSVELTYDAAGMRHYSVILTAYAGQRQVDVSVRVQKDCIRDAENVYISLPFASAAAIGTDASRKDVTDGLWLLKGTRPMRPWKDQIWGTCADFYTVQHGAALCGPQSGVVIAMPDTPLVQVGKLDYEDRLLSGHPELALRHPQLYTWLMSNYWETNFKASVEGFYEFGYRVAWGEALSDPDKALIRCEQLALGLIAFRVD
ncbi:glycoside hydrolase [Paenibacillus sp. PAMC21692]|uniref:glycoside hydrolase family 38 N-terminal domain-containing protein n=1 Tax=Paenibacillus sp. PAMC21692 TaxID=2762320 RepID=UPI00164DF8CA|nr:glycoside hydrolase [Paenibacillus sp. PAMC21692]QNK59563.1 glycoside hydrolase [Paenibacillus sp. PAMC21692]